MARQVTFPDELDWGKIIMRLTLWAALGGRARPFGRDAMLEIPLLGDGRHTAANTPAALPRKRGGLGSERRVLQLMITLSGCLFVASVLAANVGSTLLCLFACLACGTRIEAKDRRGDYGSRPLENVE
jgi:hypothetical protein